MHTCHIGIITESLLDCYSFSDRICAPNKIKIGKNAFSYLFRMHLAIIISAMVSCHLDAMSRIDVFLHPA